MFPPTWLLCSLIVWNAAILDAQGLAVGIRDTQWNDPQRNRDIPLTLYYPSFSGGSQASLAPGPFPVVIVAHGFIIDPSAYAYLWQHLVPEGWIVTVVDTEGGLSPSHQRFAEDLAFVARHLQQEQQNPLSFWYGHVSPQTVALGHSMGGGAALLAAAMEETITAVVTLAAAETSPSAIAASAHLDQPALWICGSLDCITPIESHQRPMFDAHLGPCQWLVSLEGGSHCQFASNHTLCRTGEVVSGCSAALPLSEQEQLTLSLLVPWLEAHLKGQPQAWLQTHWPDALMFLGIPQDCWLTLSWETLLASWPEASVLPLVARKNSLSPDEGKLLRP